MTIYQFDSLSNNQNIAFVPGTDALNFASHAAAQLTLTPGANLRVTAGGKSVNLTGILLGQITNSDFTFADGSVVRIGDGTTDTSNDDLGNAINISGNNNNNLVYGMLGDDTISVGNGNNIIIGGRGLGDSIDGADTITVGTGSNNINAGAGNDDVTLGATLLANTNTVNLGRGDDSLSGGGAGNAVVIGAAGNDEIDLSTSSGDITVYGGANSGDTLATSEDDSITGGTGTALLYGNGGDDLIRIQPGSGETATVYGNDGDDTIGITGGDFAGTATIYGGAGSDFISMGATSSAGVVIFGGSSAGDTADGGDTIIVSSGSDSVDAAAGNDFIVAFSDSGQTDTILGGAGNDTVIDGGPNSGDAIIYLGSGNDEIAYDLTSGSTTIYGGNGIGDSTDGNDSILSGAGSIVVYASAGDDTIDADLLGGGNTAEIRGGSGDDVIKADGAAGTLNIFGGAGADDIVASAQNDTIDGGSGSDFINSSGGADLITAGLGNDEVRTSSLDETVDGGTEAGGDPDAHDVLVIDNDNGYNPILMDGDQRKAFEEIVLDDGGVLNFLNAYFGTVEEGTLVIRAGDSNLINVNASNSTRNLEIFGNDGNDTIIGGALSNLIQGGAGNDNVTFTATTDTLDGGSDGDTLEGAVGNITFDGETITDFETITVRDTINSHFIITGDYAATLDTGGPLTVDGSGLVLSTLFADASGITLVGMDVHLIGGAGNDTLLGGDGDDTLDGGNGADSMAGGNGDDGFRFTNAQLTSADTAAGGAGGSDAIIVSDAATIVDADFLNKTSIEQIILELDAGSQSIVLSTNADATGINLIDATALTTLNTSALSVDASSGFDNNLEIDSGAGNDTLIGGAGIDTINGNDGLDTIEGGAGADSLFGGANDDTFVISALAHASGLEETIDGGAGAADAIDMNVTGNIDLSAAIISNLEFFEFAGGGNNVTVTVAQASALGFDGDDGVDTITLANGGTATFGDAGDLNFVDALVFSDSGNTAEILIANFGDLSSITGGAGDDTITLYDSGAADLSGISLSSIDVLVFNGGGNNVTLTAAQINGIDTFTGSGSTDTITMSAAGTIDLSGASVTDIDNIIGSGGIDDITATAGDNTITGGAGADSLTGGGGNDRFVFNSESDGSDIISDFFFANFTPPGRDVIALNTTAAFGTLNAANYFEGDLSSFAVSAGINVDTSTDFNGFLAAEAAVESGNSGSVDYLVVFFNSSTGNVEAWYDTDGSNNAGGGVLLFSLEGYNDHTELALMGSVNFVGF